MGGGGVGVGGGACVGMGEMWVEGSCRCGRRCVGMGEEDAVRGEVYM